jgi:ubiquinone/menaquinone biosynthesis C-methylase UbiE
MTTPRFYARNRNKPTENAGEQTTSWQGVGKWYSEITKDKGHYYHKHIILPNVLKLLNLEPKDSVLDLACGSGVLGRIMPKGVDYVGIDTARTLIDEAKKQDNNPNHSYLSGDVTKHTLTLPNGSFRPFTHATCILAIQNIKESSKVVKTAAKQLVSGGTFVIVMNHPAFRIPRQTSWGIDEQSKLQYRRVNRYMSPLEVPMNMQPSKGQQSAVTWSYHYPLHSYFSWLKAEGFLVSDLYEWTSDKESEGTAKKMEDRARQEIPLFLCLVAKKK